MIESEIRLAHRRDFGRKGLKAIRPGWISFGENCMDQKNARVIAVGNQKGGVAKTTNAVQLAAALAEAGRQCLVWDLDMNCGTTQHFGIPDNMAILGTYEVMMGEEEPRDV